MKRWPVMLLCLMGILSLGQAQEVEPRRMGPDSPRKMREDLSDGSIDRLKMEAQSEADKVVTRLEESYKLRLANMEELHRVQIDLEKQSAKEKVSFLDSLKSMKPERREKALAEFGEKQNQKRAKVWKAAVERRKKGR